MHSAGRGVLRTIKSDGQIKSSVIDKKKPHGMAFGVSPWALLAQARLIDTHYGAIAAKAVKLKPKDLVVQEKAQEEFEKMLPGQWP